MSKSNKKSHLLPTLPVIVIIAAISYASYQLFSPNPVPVGINEITVSGTQRYVAPNGSDTNSGTMSAPFKTLSKGVSVLNAGDTLLIRAGTYNEKLAPNKVGSVSSPITIRGYENETVIINGGSGSTQIERPVEITGKYITVSHLEVKNAKWACVVIAGENNTFSHSTVHECYSHGIYTDTTGNKIFSNTVYNTNLENSAKTKSSGWGSAIKLRVGAKDTTVSNNRVYNNYGEGVAATRAINTTISNNFFYDNYYVNIYIDNSINSNILNNLSTCTSNITYTKNGKRPVSIGIAEEFYDGWGNQLRDITIKNNVSGYCSHGLTYWGADRGTGGMRNVTIQNNTFYAPTHSVLSIASEPGTTNTIIINNIFDTPAAQPWINSSTGITLRDNFWVNKLPDNSTNSRGQNDIAGTISFTTNPPVFNDANSFKLVSSNPTFTAGKYGASNIETIASPPPTPTPIQKPGDLNSDGSVDVKDFNELITKFGNPYTLVHFNQIITNFGK